jgi:hypothetical protein
MNIMTTDAPFSERAPSSVSAIVTTICTGSCTGLCKSPEKTKNILRYVANDMKRTERIVSVLLKQGLECGCLECSIHSLNLAEALMHHKQMLCCRQEHDDVGALDASIRRDEILELASFVTA